MLLCIIINLPTVCHNFTTTKREKNTRKELMPEEFYKMTVSNLQTCEFRYFNVICDDNKNTEQSPRFFCIRYSFSS